jgi:protein ImuB
LGFDKVFHASPQESYFPERAWIKTLGGSQDLEPRIPLRPSRVLKKPLALKRLDNYFLHKRHKWKILSFSEAERLSGDWWLDDVERDYFRVKTEEGDELWVYLVAKSQEYFLHGIYD